MADVRLKLPKKLKAWRLSLDFVVHKFFKVLSQQAHFLSLNISVCYLVLLRQNISSQIKMMR